jgi:hypothetical protein
MDSPDNEFIFQEIVAVKSFSAFLKIPLRPKFPLYLPQCRLEENAGGLSRPPAMLTLRLLPALPHSFLNLCFHGL